MKKLLILSGKGGTGKTTTASSFIRFHDAQVFADCDVDAPNLHLVQKLRGEPEVSDFIGSEKSHIDPEKCRGCGKCYDHCRFGAIRKVGDKYEVNEFACEGCGVCQYVCPCGAVTMAEDVAGGLTLYKEGKVFSTAKLKMGRGNSGKLVTQVKTNMVSAKHDADLAIIDGSPGIGCPVIASVTGVDLVLIVAEPSRSGMSDLQRILRTAEILHAPTAVCINKYDVSPEMTEAIEDFCNKQDIPLVGRVPYDKAVAQAVNAGHPIAEVDCPARDALLEAYHNTMSLMDL